ncbi:MAG: class I SAM-dependent methyltransferase [Sphingomonadales bacterium]
MNLNLSIQPTRQKYEETFPGVTVYDAKDWFRLEFASKLAIGSGNSIANIGTGPGAMEYFLAEIGQFKCITSLDIVCHSKLISHPIVDYQLGDLRDTGLNINFHDVVFCMEVLEHIEEQHNAVMLSTLRKATARRLVITVPDCEPEPLWWHDKPGGHRQNFTREKMAALFPNALATIIPRYGIDWMLIVEDEKIGNSEFQVQDREQFLLALMG